MEETGVIGFPFASRLWLACVIVLLGPGVLSACARAEPLAFPGTAQAPARVDRASSIPVGKIKISPETDPTPPQSFLPGYAQPVPVPGLVNTAGAEDSPFILPDGDTLYFFFTPDLGIPAEKQLLDGVTGIYRARLVGGEWQAVERVWLQEPGRLALDGCAFILGSRLWFCSTREGYTGLNWFTAELAGDHWQNWQLAQDTDFGFDPAYQVGELHISPDGQELYFASGRLGGQGGLDLWVSRRVEGHWAEPEPLVGLNTPGNEGWPALSLDGSQLWFMRDYDTWRSLRDSQNPGEWLPPEKAFGPLAGEPSVDSAGNVYFVHHYLLDGVIIEADLYIARPIP